MVFKSSHNIYEMERNRGIRSISNPSGPTSLDGDVAIKGNLTVNGITANGPVVANAGMTVQGGLNMDTLNLGGDLTLASTAWIYNGDQFTIGSFRTGIVAGELRRYERVASTGVDQTDWIETSTDNA